VSCLQIETSTNHRIPSFAIGNYLKRHFGDSVLASPSVVHQCFRRGYFFFFPRARKSKVISSQGLRSPPSVFYWHNLTAVPMSVSPSLFSLDTLHFSFSPTSSTMEARRLGLVSAMVVVCCLSPHVPLSCSRPLVRAGEKKTKKRNGAHPLARPSPRPLQVCM
jgi:hypothetical protein